MRVLHAIGLSGLLYRHDGPWPFVVPAQLPASHQEEILAMLQGATGGGMLPRVELAWRLGFSQTELRVFLRLRWEFGPNGFLCVVRLHDVTELRLVMQAPELQGLGLLTIVVARPGGGEPLKPLLDLRREVWGALVRQYDRLVEPLDLASPTLEPLLELREHFLSPVDWVRLVDDFVTEQTRGTAVPDAAFRACERRLDEQIASLSKSEQAVLFASLRGNASPEGPAYDDAARMLQRCGLIAEGEDGRWGGRWWASLLTQRQFEGLIVDGADSAHTQIQQLLASFALSQATFLNEQRRQLRSNVVQSLARMVVTNSLDQAADLLIQAHTYLGEYTLPEQVILLTTEAALLTADDVVDGAVDKLAQAAEILRALQHAEHSAGDRTSPDAVWAKTWLILRANPLSSEFDLRSLAALGLEVLASGQPWAQLWLESYNAAPDPALLGQGVDRLALQTDVADYVPIFRALWTVSALRPRRLTADGVRWLQSIVAPTEAEQGPVLEIFGLLYTESPQRRGLWSLGATLLDQCAGYRGGIWATVWLALHKRSRMRAPLDELGVAWVKANVTAPEVFPVLVALLGHPSTRAQVLQDALRFVRARIKATNDPFFPQQVAHILRMLVHDPACAEVSRDLGLRALQVSDPRISYPILEVLWFNAPDHRDEWIPYATRWLDLQPDHPSWSTTFKMLWSVEKLRKDLRPRGLRWLAQNPQSKDARAVHRLIEP